MIQKKKKTKSGDPHHFTLGAKPYFRGAEILNFRSISAAFAQYFRGAEI
jgi:hypothetical protein